MWEPIEAAPAHANGCVFGPALIRFADGTYSVGCRNDRGWYEVGTSTNFTEEPTHYILITAPAP
jgi:hypothetical protein